MRVWLCVLGYISIVNPLKVPITTIVNPKQHCAEQLSSENTEKSFLRQIIKKSILYGTGFCISSLIGIQLPNQYLHCMVANAVEVDLKQELQDYNIDIESEKLRKAKEPQVVMKSIKRKISPNRQKLENTKSSPKDIQLAQDKVLTLKAYLDEVERDLFDKNWENLQVYLYTFAEQENSFAALIQQLFPSSDPLDQSAREALSFEAQSMFLALDDLRDAAKDQKFKVAQNAYSKLLLSYDRFLKAGNLYPTYDAITSNEIFFKGTPKDTLPFDTTHKVQVLDEVVLTSGPDMGKTGTVIYIDGDSAVVKLDKDGKAYQEVKYVKYGILARAEGRNENHESKKKTSKNQFKLFKL